MALDSIDTLVLSGGALKGIATLGALQVVDEYYTMGPQLKHVVGVSVGAIIGTLYTINWTPSELITHIYELDFTTLYNPRMYNLYEGYGLDDGDAIKNTLYRLFKQKNISKTITFKEHFEKFKVKLSIGVTNLSTLKFEIWNHENHPNESLIDALRTSFSIPFIFTFQRFQSGIYIDGSVSNTFPMDLVSGEKVLGIHCSKGIELPDATEKKWSFKTFAFQVLKCLRNKHTTTFTTTIYIDSKVSGGPLNFNLPLAEKRKLVTEGRAAAERFLLLPPTPGKKVNSL